MVCVSSVSRHLVAMKTLAPFLEHGVNVSLGLAVAGEHGNAGPRRGGVDVAHAHDAHVAHVHGRVERAAVGVHRFLHQRPLAGQADGHLLQPSKPGNQVGAFHG